MEDVQVLKQALLERISGIDDYDVLQVLSEDVEVYVTRQKAEGPYDFPGATEEERERLIRFEKDELPDDEEYLTQEQFDEEMRAWRTK